MRSLFWKWLWANTTGGLWGALAGFGTLTWMMRSAEQTTYLRDYPVIRFVFAAVLVGGLPALFVLIVARAQRKALLPHLSIGRGWAWASALGAALGVGAGFGITLVLPPQLPKAIASAISLISLSLGLGVGIGLAQWFYLRRAMPRAGWWIAAYPIGIALAGIVAWEGIRFVLRDPGGQAIEFAYVGAVAWIVTSVTTGIVLVRLLGRIASPQAASHKEADEVAG